MGLSMPTMARPRPNCGENEEFAFFTFKLTVRSGCAGMRTGELARGAGFGVKMAQ